MNNIKPKKLASDERGTLIELFGEERLGVEGLVYVVSFSKAGVVRGNHYHKFKIEVFVALSEGIQLEIFDLKGKLISHTIMEIGYRYIIYPEEVHKLTSTKDTESYVVAYITEEFDPDDPDTFTL